MKTAWLIDDDEEMSTAVSLMLKLLDYSTRSFLDAPTAANTLLDGEKPDLILLDLNMPQVSGKDFLEFVRRKPEFNSLPILMLSSEFADVEVHSLLNLGADAYVTKPVTIEELGRALAQAVQNRTLLS
jgi:DNA-binding response OmpR family regulator